MEPKIVAQRLTAPVYIVQVSDTMGRILDVGQGTISMELLNQSILARGYWNPPLPTTPPLADLLAQAGVTFTQES
jgi:hypothetical protein